MQGQQPVAEVLNPSPVQQGTSGSGTELLLAPPINSTLEIRVARRPWLLEKLTGPKTEPSVKMTPPSPPAEIRKPASDPPSLRSINAQNQNLEWRLRGGLEPGTAEPSVKLPASDETTKSAVETPSYASEVAPQPPKSAEELDSDLKSTTNPMRPSVGSNEPVEVSPIAEPPGEVEAIKVRELRIDVDGTPLASETEQAESQPDETESSTTPEASTEDDTKPQTKATPDATARVGDVNPEMDPEEALPAAPPVDLDYTGYPRQRMGLTRTVRSMQSSLRACLRYYYARPEDANERSNWGVLHSIMVYGGDTKIKAGNRSYNAIAWIAGNNACRGERILTEQDGRIVARSGIGLQGHQAQLLAILALCDVPFDYTLYADNNRYTVGDLIESEMLACRSGEELTFTLIGLAHYLDTDIAWRNADGEIWDFERLIREELSQTIVGAACGGTHRLMGYAHALRKRRAEGKPITGQWRRAEIYTQDFVNYAYRLQNRDGSMTTDWFEGREDNGDLDRKIQTTGHIVEWLLTVTPDSQLQDRRLVSAVRFLLTSMYEERDHEWKIGPKGHALRSLAMYYERVYRSGPAWRTPSVARSQSSNR